MKFSLSVLVAAVFLFCVAASASVVDVTTLEETSGGPGHPRRTLFSKKNPTAAAAVAAVPPPPQMLFVQASTDCALTPSATSGEYRFRATVGTATTYFSERPVRMASTIATQTFAEQFKDNFFVTSNPNGAITFSGDNNNTGPLIIELSRPRMVSSIIIEYTMTQSSSQAKVATIDQFMETSGSCSIFIDSAKVNACLPSGGTFSGTSTLSNCEDTVFETCFQAGSSSTYCWTKAYYNKNKYFPCIPNGTEWSAIDADYVNPVTKPTRSCGLPCQIQHQEEMNIYFSF